MIQRDAVTEMSFPFLANWGGLTFSLVNESLKFPFCPHSDDSVRPNPALRRKSANVHGLLLEMPFPLVRDRLTHRVHRLSRRLWRRLKQQKARESVQGDVPCNSPIPAEGEVHFTLPTFVY